MGARDETVPASAGGETETPSDERYVLLDRLGEGGMGVVWKAHDRVLDRTVALKVLHDQFLGAGDQERLVVEARAMARLSHPNVVAVYDAGEREGRAYLTMELVRGEPLSRWLETPRRWQEILAVFRDAALGVAAAHDAGIVHRDLKPSNILVGDDGRVRVADFGVAHASAAPEPEDGGGTPAYMPPERRGGAAGDERGDQYSFSVALHEALHGRLPPATARDVPRWLAAAVARGLADDPAARHPSMRALHAAIDRRPRRWLVAGLGGGAAAVSAVVFFLAGGAAAPAPCADIERHVRPIWNEDARRRLEVGFLASGEAYAADAARDAVAELDRRTAAWVRARHDVCRSARIDRETDAATERARIACLDDQLVDLRAAVAYLVSGAGGVPGRAWESARRLPSPRHCFAPAPADPAAVRGAEELLERGRLDLSGGELDRAIVAFDGAAQAARAQGADGLRADAMIAQAVVLAQRGFHDDAEGTLDQAAAVLSGKKDFTRERELSLARSDLLAWRGQHALAAMELNRAWKLAVAEHGADSLEAAAMLLRRAEAALEIGEHELAREDAARALELFAPLGEGHPEVERARAVLHHVASSIR